MLRRVKVCAILDFGSLKGIFDQPPELSLNHILWNFAIWMPLVLEPFFLKAVALLLERAEGVLLALLESKILTSNKTFGAIPVCFRDMLQRWSEAEGVMAQLTILTDQYLVQVSTRMANLTSLCKVHAVVVASIAVAILHLHWRWFH